MTLSHSFLHFSVAEHPAWVHSLAAVTVLQKHCAMLPGTLTWAGTQECDNWVTCKTYVSGLVFCLLICLRSQHTDFHSVGLDFHQQCKILLPHPHWHLLPIFLMTISPGCFLFSLDKTSLWIMTVLELTEINLPLPLAVLGLKAWLPPCGFDMHLYDGWRTIFSFCLLVIHI